MAGPQFWFSVATRPDEEGTEMRVSKKKLRSDKADISCLECGGSLRLAHRDYQFDESGLNNVVLKNLEVLVCEGCKAETPRIPRFNGLMRTIAMALISKPYKLEGQDIRFLRKFLGLSSEAFAALLDVDKSHLSRVENGATPVSATADRLVRLVALELGEGLEQNVRAVIVNFAQIKQARKLKLLVDAATRSVKYRAA